MNIKIYSAFIPFGEEAELKICLNVKIMLALVCFVTLTLPDTLEI